MCQPDVLGLWTRWGSGGRHRDGWHPNAGAGLEGLVTV